jgi:hypothetical protein
VKAGQITVTPKLAQQLIDKHPAIRPLNLISMESHVRAMKEGRWIDEASGPIVIGRGGEMQNGNTRLHATIEAGHVWQAMLIEDAPADANLYQDTGRRRSFAEYLRTKGVKQGSHIQAVVRLMWFWDNGLMTSRLDFTRSRINMPPDHAMLWAYYNGAKRQPGHKDEIAEAMRIGRWIKRTMAAQSVATCAAILCTRVDEQETEHFFWQMALREPPAEQAMATARALENMRPGAGQGAKGDQQHQLAVIIKGWNYFRDGEYPSNVRWRSGGPSPEKMPEPR